MKIVMAGAGYVRLVSGACFADFGHDVVCIDKDQSKIDRSSIAAHSKEPVKDGSHLNENPPPSRGKSQRTSTMASMIVAVNRGGSRPAI